MLERGVRMVQLFHRGWDQHLNLDRELRAQSKDTDQASAALVVDLERRGLLEDTLVVWGGEFGRTVYSQGRLGAPGSGRDHHGRCFTVWMAGGGVRPGIPRRDRRLVVQRRAWGRPRERPQRHHPPPLASTTSASPIRTWGSTSG